MKEKWVQINKIQGYENISDCYWISNSDEDKIMNKGTGKIMKIGLNNKGYLRVGLMTNNSKTRVCRVHTLKAKAFIYNPNPLTYNIIRHLNDIKTDNRLENLAWGTQSDNVRDCIRNGNYYNHKGCAKASIMGGKKTGAKNGKKRSKPVKCLDTGIIYLSTRDAGRKLGISNANISLCCNKKKKTAGGFHFEFINRGDE